MSESRAQRTLVKSPPELWSELSDPASLARHLGEFGDIRITRLEPESRVEWEAQGARGSVELAASGWGTKVTLTAEVAQAEPTDRETVRVPGEGETIDPDRARDPAPDPEPEPEPNPGVGQPPSGPTPAAGEHDGPGGDAAEPWGEWHLPEWPVQAWTTAGAASRSREAPQGGFQIRRLPAQAHEEPVGQESSVAEPPAPNEDDHREAVMSEGRPPAHRPSRGFFARLFGWQTRIEEPVLQWEPAAHEPEPDPGPDPEPDPDPGPNPEPELARPQAEAEPPLLAETDQSERQPELQPEPEPEQEPDLAGPPARELDEARTEAVLTGILDDLGAAHHRPFSR